MRAIAIVVLFCIVTSFLVTPVPAHAERRGGGNWKEAAIALGLVWLLGELAPNSQQPTSTPPVSPPAAESLRQAPQPEGGLLIKQVSGPANTSWVAEEVLKAAGWSMINDQARRAAAEENQRHGGNNEVAAASWFVFIRAEFSQASEYEQSEYNRYRYGSSSSSSSARGTKCTVYLTVANGGTTSYSASGVGFSWSRYERFNWNSCRWGNSSSSYTPQDRDWALLSAMVAASNGITRQTCPIVAPDVQAHYCPGCGKATPQGANFCPFCGSRLTPATQPAPTN